MTALARHLVAMMSMPVTATTPATMARRERGSRNRRHRIPSVPRSESNLMMEPHSSSSLSPRSIVFIGLVALAIAMGIGRFAFTPMMPLMVRDGSLDAVTGTEWATANYVGYLLGAISASWFARSPRRGLQVGLVGVAATTLATAWGDAALPWVGMALRGSAGVFSAWVLVCASSWCLPELARRHATSLGGWIYTGVGLGIAATGVLTWLGGAHAASARAARRRRGFRRGGRAAARSARGRERKPGGGAVLQRVRLRLHHSRDLPAHDGPAAGVRSARVRAHLAHLRHGGGAVGGLCRAPAARLVAPQGVGDRAGGDGGGHRAPAAAAGLVGAGGLGRPGRRDLHGHHHGGPSARARAHAHEPDAAAGAHDHRLRRRTDRRSAARAPDRRH